MKRLWQVIEREMQAQGLTAHQMAQKLRVDPAQLSRLRGGHLRDLSAEALGNILTGLRSSPAAQTELLAAYLSDKLGGRVSTQLASAVADGLRVAEEATDYAAGQSLTIPELCERAGLSARVARAFGILADEASGNRRLQDLLVSLANYARKEIPH
jgi:transcriptional regulator with XRE-family HTH domain